MRRGINWVLLEQLKIELLMAPRADVQTVEEYSNILRN